MPSRLIPTFDPSPLGLQRLYARLLLAMLLPLALLHAGLWALGATTPLAVVFEAAMALLAWRLLANASASGFMGRPTAPVVGLTAIGLLAVATAFETGGVGSPQVVLVIVTTAFAGLLLEARRVVHFTLVLVAAYAFFALGLSSGLTHAALSAQDGGPLVAWHRLPVTELTALVQNAVYLGLAAFTAHAAKGGLHTQWAQMQQRARRDALTQLPNRLGFREDLLRVLARPSALELPLAVLMVDLDHFKLVNDRFGHAVGDDVLRQTGAILRETVGPVDHVGRLGGEEFVVAAVGTDAHHAVDLAARIVRGFRAHPWNQIRHDLRVTCSVGIFILQPELLRTDPSAALAYGLQKADGALYIVKGNGRDGYHVAPGDSSPGAAMALGPTSALAAPGTPRTLSLDRGPSGSVTPR